MTNPGKTNVQYRLKRRGLFVKIFRVKVAFTVAEMKCIVMADSSYLFRSKLLSKSVFFCGGITFRQVNYSRVEGLSFLEYILRCGPSSVQPILSLELCCFRLCIKSSWQYMEENWLADWITDAKTKVQEFCTSL